MRKQGLLFTLLGVALGANMMLAAWIVTLTVTPQTVAGGTVDGSGAYTVATGKLQSKGDADAIFIWSHEEKKLAVYFQSGRGIDLLGVRNCEHDFRINEYGKSNYPVKEVKKDLKKGSKK